MKMAAVASSLMLLAALCTGCRTEPSKLKTLRTTVAGLNLADPEADAVRNFSLGDTRFIGIRDVGCHAPGREGIELGDLVKAHGLRCLDGTTDALEDDAHRVLQGKVVQYGIAYNKRLAALIAARSNNSFKPRPLRGLDGGQL